MILAFFDGVKKKKLDRARQDEKRKTKKKKNQWFWVDLSHWITTNCG